ncbi:spondin domain-containing protein [Pelagibaculum spongiae]|uniref:Spondin domain-containing protein n=1 Tax=Pelagibaculum spongiae TaxID=2080658 RepID=A0A2V1H2D6_9GAMM|nr:spondin domain-containing protein [Pelagibaculum spongiae]PVZ70179.1 hypothetical protein DC094_06135 [Pelagibaculum spongiae]
MKKQLILLSFAALSLAMPSAHARTISINMTNLMHGTYITPQIAATHTSSYTLFRVGTDATEALRIMAETGNVGALNKNTSTLTIGGPGGATGIVADLNNNNQLDGQIPSTSDQVVNASGTNDTAPVILLAPGTNQDYTDINLTESNTHLSIVGMLMPSNDGFVGLDSWKIPAGTGSWVVYLNAYDAGTEANTEQTIPASETDQTAADGACNLALDETNTCTGVFIPFHPDAGNNNAAGFGVGGSAVGATDSNDKVHIHRGHLGELDASDNTGDLKAKVHRWLNPVAKVVITISE